MSALPLIIAGLGWTQVLVGPPPAGLWGLLALCALVCMIPDPRGPLSRTLAPALLAAAWSCWHVETGLSQRLVERHPVQAITGRVAGLTDHDGDRLSFPFETEAGPWGTGSRRIEVRWFEAPVTPRPGERWRLPLRLAPPRGRVNFSGGDAERYFFAQRIHALGTVKTPGAVRLEGPGGHVLARLREKVRARVRERLGEAPGTALVLALGLGDRSGLDPALLDAMRGTGTGHLLAISGLHVGLVALFGFGAGRGVLALAGWRGRRWPARRLAVLLGLGAATAYALLAGFGTSPRRALVMLTVAAVALLMRRRIGAWRCWLLALVGVLLLDPLAPLGAGFWLSFGAVAVLLHQFRGRRPVHRGAGALLRAQAGIGLALLPLGMAWFEWASASALVVNLVAIPFVSAVTLPLVLLGLAGLVSDSAPAQIVLATAAGSAAWLEGALITLQETLHGGSGPVPGPGRVSVALGLAGGALALLPPGLRLRRFGVLMVLPLFLPAAVGLGKGDLRLEMLDVGQGQAALVQTRKHLLLADAGPGMPGRWDRVDSVLRPAVRQRRPGRPDLLLVSHGDLDHAGGLQGLRGAWPSLPVTGNAPRPPPDMAPCHTGRAWTWDDVRFRVLHPSPWLPYQGNDSSCVLAVQAPGGGALLPGDIGHLVERRLARQPGSGFSLMLSPHHGSRSSSTDAFLAWARPRVVVITSGHGNRFGFPHMEVLERLAARNRAVTGTAACGALRFTLRATGSLEAHAARHARPGFWRYAPAPHCPNRGPVPTLTSPEPFRYHAGHSDKQ